MQKITVTHPLLGAVLGFGILLSACAQSADPVAKVNGTAIPQSRMDANMFRPSI